MIVLYLEKHIHIISEQTSMLHAMGSAGLEAVKRLESIIGLGRTRSELERALFLARGDENRALDILFQVRTSIFRRVSPI